MINYLTIAKFLWKISTDRKFFGKLIFYSLDYDYLSRAETYFKLFSFKYVILFFNVVMFLRKHLPSIFLKPPPFTDVRVFAARIRE